MNRRTLLTRFGSTALALSGTVATGGCLGRLAGPFARSGGSPADGTGTPTARPTRVTTDDGDVVDVGSLDVQPSVLVMGVHTAVRAYAGTSFLRLPVVLRTEAGTPITALDRYQTLREASSVRLGGTTHDQVAVDRAHDGPGVVLALAVPFGDYDGGEFDLALGGGSSIHVPLSADVLAAIADPAAFEVSELSVEAPIEGDVLSATLSVENVGGTAGRFLAELGPTSRSDAPEVRFDVQAGEEVRRGVRVDNPVPPGSEEATIRLDWGVDQLERTVAVGES